MSRILFAIELTRSNDTCPLMPQATNIAWRITTGVGRMQKKPSRVMLDKIDIISLQHSPTLVNDVLFI